MSCASESFCVAAFFDPDDSGLTDALTWNGSNWSAPVVIDQDGKATYVSCPSSTFCDAVDYNGNSVTFNGTSWSAPVSVDGQLPAVSCPSSSFCTAVSANGFGTGTAYIYDGSSWAASVGQLDSSGLPDEISCTSASFCAVADNEGNVFIGTG
jgi:hypothetical protein